MALVTISINHGAPELSSRNNDKGDVTAMEEDDVRPNVQAPIFSSDLSQCTPSRYSPIDDLVSDIRGTAAQKFPFYRKEVKTRCLRSIFSCRAGHLAHFYSVTAKLLASTSFVHPLLSI
ncbi:hypothetical protein Acr_05g0000540 [Actinidia rufa]|uniref:Uncharacterized protein n=1 Tax=Actinidia rufa TaxID=165716 RepID=A0A7J0EIW6_9ERIC|nr:hypothetical protein Acr_05g0000540 [Actinidia rufa]